MPIYHDLLWFYFIVRIIVVLKVTTMYINNMHYLDLSQMVVIYDRNVYQSDVDTYILDLKPEQENCNNYDQ